MSKKANPAIVGLFLVIGFALAVAGVLVFSSGRLFRVEQKYILYFNGSLKGLDPGAPVKFRGVTIGKVDVVLVRHNQADDDFVMPVIVSIDTKLTQSKSDRQLEFNKDRMDYLVEHGFRARLDAESLVTGVLYIGLEMLPNPPAPVFHQLKPEFIEIPTMESHVQKLLANLDRVDIGTLSEKINALLTRLDGSLSELNVAQINAGLTNLLNGADRLIESPDLTNSIVALKGTLNNAQALLKRIDGRVDPLVDSVTNTLYGAQKTLADLRLAVQNVNDLLGPDSAIRPELVQALESLGNAGQAVADLAEFIKRNPNALLAGTKRPKEEP